MITKRLTILLAVLLGGMSTIFLLPKHLGFQPAGIEMGLPKMVGGWYGQEIDITDKERNVLGGQGTEFARAIYRNGRGYEITASIVLSGQDMNSSIHRPERCLQAQGFTVIDQRSVAVAPPNREALHVKRLQNVRDTPDVPGTPPLYSLTYYWFEGFNVTTDSHIKRAIYDARDRLFHGYNQRWAYIMIAANLPPNSSNDPAIERTVDGWVQDFIKQLVPKIEKAG